MKSPFFAPSLLLAAIALPQAGLAQETGAAPAIIVSGEYQRDWERGNKLEAEGLKELEKARKDLIGYSADVVEAQNKRDSSAARADNAEAEFRRLTSAAGPFNDPREAVRWAKDLEEAASEWARYEKRRDDGRSDLEKAIRRQQSAQSEVDEAQQDVDRGRTMKAEAQRKSLAARN